MNKKKSILEDHKKVGSRFVPPMCQLGMTEVSYVNQILPEIIWMGLLNKREGYRVGIGIVEFIAKRLNEIKTTEKHINFSLASSYEKIGQAQKDQIMEELDKNKYLSKLQEALSPLVCLYDGFPMSFVGPPKDLISRESMLKNLKRTVSECIDKYDQPGMVIQSSVMYIRGITGGLYFNKGMRPPDLEKIITDFDSDEGKMAAASVRAFVMTEYMPMGEEKSDKWSESFWNQGYKIDTCKFPWEENE